MFKRFCDDKDKLIAAEHKTSDHVGIIDTHNLEAKIYTLESDLNMKKAEIEHRDKQLLDEERKLSEKNQVIEGLQEHVDVLMREMKRIAKPRSFDMIVSLLVKWKEDRKLKLKEGRMKFRDDDEKKNRTGTVTELHEIVSATQKKIEVTSESIKAKKMQLEELKKKGINLPTEKRKELDQKIQLFMDEIMKDKLSRKADRKNIEKVRSCESLSTLLRGRIYF